VIVEHQRDDVVEAVDESIRGSRADQSVEATVEFRKVVIASVDIHQKIDVVLPHGHEFPPSQRALG
jgi:hypothetical protein